MTAAAQPYHITYDPVDGNLWFTEWAGGKIGRINPTTKAVTEYPIPLANPYPEEITVDASGNVWFVEPGLEKIGELSPNDPSVINEYSVPGQGGGIVAGPDGNIWFTERVNSASYIAVFQPSSGTVIAQVHVPLGHSAGVITVGPDNNLWFTDGSSNSGYIGMITTSGIITEYAVPNAQPQAITAAPRRQSLVHR